jgi:hypothetical protein
MTNIITSCLYTSVNKLDNGQYQYHEGIYNEIININKILSYTSKNEVIKDPPLLQLYVILIPGNIHTDKESRIMNVSELYKLPNSGRFKITQNYSLKKKDRVYGSFKLSSIHIHGIISSYIKSQIREDLLPRFKYIPYKIVNNDEYYFMDHLLSKGSFLDIIKARSIMQPGKNILHMDTNTCIVNWNELYKNTFDQPKRHDLFGLSRCSAVYIAFHNKFLYICGESAFPKRLNDELNELFENRKHDELIKQPWYNAAYDLIWTKCAFDFNYTHKFTVKNRNDPSKTFNFYPAAALNPIYGLNKYYMTIQRQSWRDTKETHKKLFGREENINLNSHEIVIDEDLIKSFQFLYTDIPKLEDASKSYVEKIIQYEKIDLKDYIALINQQPNQEYKKIMDQINISLQDQDCKNKIPTEIEGEPMPIIDPNADELRCIAKEMSGPLYGGMNEEQFLIEDAYDYEKNDNWKTVTVTGGKTKKHRTKKRSIN